MDDDSIHSGVNISQFNYEEVLSMGPYVDDKIYIHYNIIETRIIIQSFILDIKIMTRI